MPNYRFKAGHSTNKRLKGIYYCEGKNDRIPPGDAKDCSYIINNEQCGVVFMRGKSCSVLEGLDKDLKRIVD